MLWLVSAALIEVTKQKRRGRRVANRCSINILSTILQMMQLTIRKVPPWQCCAGGGRWDKKFRQKLVRFPDWHRRVGRGTWLGKNTPLFFLKLPPYQESIFWMSDVHGNTRQWMAAVPGGFFLRVSPYRWGQWVISTHQAAFRQYKICLIW